MKASRAFLFGLLLLTTQARADECDRVGGLASPSLTPLALAKPNPPVRGSHAMGALDPASPISLTLTLRPHAGAPDLDKMMEAQNSLPPAQRHYLTREELAKLEGADPGETNSMVSYLKSQGLKITSQDLGSRTIQVTGNVADVNHAFAVSLQNYAGPDGQAYHTTAEAPSVPVGLKDAITGIFGLDNRRVAFPRRGGMIRRPSVGGEDSH